MKVAFLFSGQGAQEKGMGKDLFDTEPVFRKRIEEAEGILPYSLTDIMFEDEKRLSSGRYGQVAIFAMGVALKDLMEEKGITSEGSAGLSLGEYTAYYDRGVYGFATGIRLIDHRAHFMTEATADLAGGMLAVRASIDDVVPVVESLEGIYIANHNLEKQIVVAGSDKDLKQFQKAAEKKGIRRIRPLPTTGPFHTPLMEKAARSLCDYLFAVKLQPPRGKLYLNTTGRCHTDENLKDTMCEHMTSTVRFYDLLVNMVADGFDTFVELGPGGILRNFVKKTHPGVEAYHVEDADTLEHTLDNLKGVSSHEC